MMLKLIMETNIGDDGTSVEMFITDFGYAVRYGLQVNGNLTFNEATDEYDDCILHALRCAGLSDEEEAA